MAETQREDIRIPAKDQQLAAYFYPPLQPEQPAPCVVMAHGFSGTRDDALTEYAEAFQHAGYAVVLFDYRHFGASTGEPRQLLDIGRQVDDYRTVMAWARHRTGVDPERIVLWGTSFSGGHVLTLAAEDPRVAAVIAQAPFVDALPTLGRLTPKNAVRLTLAGLRDRARALSGRRPHLIPAVAAPGELAAMTAPDAKPGFEALAPPESLWRNEFAARIMLTFAFYRPALKAPHISAPILLCVCDTDSTTPALPAVKVARRAPRGELKIYSYGHFDIYHDTQVKADQVAFLRRVVPHTATQKI